MQDKQIIQQAITELTRSMSLAADREELQSAADMKRISELLKQPTLLSFDEKDITDLQSEVYKITGKGEVMQLFNKLLGVSAG